MSAPIVVAFTGHTRLARGALESVALAAREVHAEDHNARIAFFDDATGQPVDVDLNGTEGEVRAGLRYHPLNHGSGAATGRRGPGRPKLGVVSREVSLLPRHWAWLAEQRGGASASLRRLVDEARKREGPEQDERRAIEAAHRFAWDIAGDAPGFEEASRALFARDFERFETLTADWPDDIREQIARFLSRRAANVSDTVPADE